jgi:hypothetical protein
MICSIRISCILNKQAQVEKVARNKGLSCLLLGEVGGSYRLFILPARPELI